MPTGSNDSINYLEHNGGLDYFGNSVSHYLPSNIGAFNGELSTNILTLKLDELKIFPSLTDDYVNISIDNYFGPITTEIYSLGGKFLDVQFGDRLSFNSFDPGVYVCLIFYENNFKSVKVVRL